MLRRLLRHVADSFRANAAEVRFRRLEGECRALLDDMTALLEKDALRRATAARQALREAAREKREEEPEASPQLDDVAARAAHKAALRARVRASGTQLQRFAAGEQE